MKAVRLLLLSLAVLAVLALVATGVALNASFQTWIVRRELAKQPDLQGTVGRVSVGLSKAELREVNLRSQGALLTLPSLDAELPLISAGLNERVLVSRLVAKGWTLDLSNAAPAAAPTPVASGGKSSPGLSLVSTAQAASPAASSGATAAAAEAFRGVFALLQLPVDLALDGVELDGEVILPALPDVGAARVRVTLSGGGLGAGREGKFALGLAGTKADGGAVTIDAILTATMDTPRTFTRVGLKSNAAASGTQFPQGVKLDVDAHAVREATAENYTLTLANSGKQLAGLKAALTPATSRIAGTWQLDLRDSDLTPFALGRKLPTFSAVGEGGFETGTAFDEIHASGQLKASAARLDVVLPELSAIGATDLVADFDVLQHGDSLRVERLNATVSGAAPVASVQALQPFEFNLKTAELRVANPAADLVGVVLNGVPLAWARPFLGDLEVTGGDVRGEFAASARDGGLALRAKSPLTLSRVSVTQAGQPLLTDVDIALSASADYTPQGWQAQVTELALSQKAAPLLTLDAKAGRLTGDNQPVKFTGHWRAQLPAWLQQPVLAGQMVLTSGVGQGEFSGSLDGTQAIETKLVFNNLVAITKEKLPAITIELRADVAADGKVTFQSPWLFEIDGRKSDLLLAGSLTPGADLTAFDARVSGDRVVVEDVQLLALLVPSGPPAANPTPTGPEVVPFWNGVKGQASLALKKVVYGAGYEVSDVAGTLRIDASALKLEGVHAVFGPESDLKLAGGVTFDPKAKEAYALTGEMTVTNFDAGAAFRAIDPTQLPTVEAHVNLTSRVTGTGANLAEAGERVKGDLQVTGRSGVFRALSANVSDKVQKSQSTVATLGGLLGAMTGKQEYSDYANKTQILTDITKALAEIPFDQLNVTATRDDQLNVVLKDFTLISPEVRLTGAGGIQHRADKALLEQPLTLQLDLRARGKLADLIKRAGLLDDAADTLGYFKFGTPIKLAGTLQRPDASELGKALLNSALQKSGLLDSLLGK